MRRNFAGHRENGEDRFVLRGPNFLSAEGAPDDSLGCSEAEPQEMPKIDQALKERQMSRAGFHFQS